MAAGQSTQACDSSSGVCVAFSIPMTSQTTAQTAEVLATVEGPAGLGWLGFGFGGEMAGSLIFVVWLDGQQVVVSSRLGTLGINGRGHHEPNVYLGPSISVLSSNITSNAFTTTLSLSNATIWQNSGFLDISSSSASIIWALGTSAPSNPSSPNSDFPQHAYEGTFSINMAAAQTTKSSSNSNAGTGSSNSGSVKGGGDVLGGFDGPGTKAGSSSSSESTSSSASVPQITGDNEQSSSLGGVSPRQKMIIAHGTIMGVCFGLLFPFGGIIIRFLSSFLPSPVKLHYSLQLFAFALVLVAGGLGVSLSNGLQLSTFRTTPPITLSVLHVDQVFGLVIIAMIILQITLGYYHHQRYILDRPNSRRWFTHAHLWLGRFVILVGLINCGTGLDLASVSRTGVIAWYVTFGVLALFYAMGVMMTIQWRAKRGKENVYSAERYKTTEAYEMGGQSRGAMI